MRKLITLSAFFLLLNNISYANNKIEVFSIYAGNKQATFFQVAKSICDVFNRNYLSYGYLCKAIAAKGSVDNLYKAVQGKADFAITKSLDQHMLFLGEKKISHMAKKIQPIVTLHDELFTILVSNNSGIESLDDFDDKIVNIGNVGSSSSLVTEKYLSTYKIKPQITKSLGASEAFKQICNNELDAWAYFVGHPNKNYEKTLKNCDVKLLKVTKQEKQNLGKLFPYLSSNKFNKELYPNLYEDLATVSSSTILIARKNLNPEIIELILDIVENKKSELITEADIFKLIDFEPLY